MRVQTDDDLDHIDAIFLGPREHKFLWKATYLQYGLWMVCMIFLASALHTIGQPLLSTWGVIAGIISIVFSTCVSRAIRSGHSFTTLLRAIANEISAPRLPKNTPERILIGSKKTQHLKKEAGMT